MRAPREVDDSFALCRRKTSPPSFTAVDCRRLQMEGCLIPGCTAFESTLARAEGPACQAGLSCSQNGPRHADHLKQLIVRIVHPHDLAVHDGIVFIAS